MRAIILAGGKGTRLRPYTVTFPKPLVPLGGEMPVLEIIIRQLSRQGVSHITLAVNHLANLIQAFFQDGSKWGLRIHYSLEEQPLHTIGPLTLLHDLPENFLVMNGDVLCDLDFRAFYEPTAPPETTSPSRFAGASNLSTMASCIMATPGASRAS